MEQVSLAGNITCHMPQTSPKARSFVTTVTSVTQVHTFVDYSQIMDNLSVLNENYLHCRPRISLIPSLGMRLSVLRQALTWFRCDVSSGGGHVIFPCRLTSSVFFHHCEKSWGVKDWERG